jgi:hypothetical protein
LLVAEAVRSTIMKKLGGIMLQWQHVVMPEIGYFQSIDLCDWKFPLVWGDT